MQTFDMVNPDVLLHQLLSFDICNNTFNWFKSYLTNRSQSVRWNGTQTDNLGISKGVPQVSILEPLFFILYVDDYLDCLRYSLAHMFAEDTTHDEPDKRIDVIEYK